MGHSYTNQKTRVTHILLVGKRETIICLAALKMGPFGIRTMPYIGSYRIPPTPEEGTFALLSGFRLYRPRCVLLLFRIQGTGFYSQLTGFEIQCVTAVTSANAFLEVGGMKVRLLTVQYKKALHYLTGIMCIKET